MRRAPNKQTKAAVYRLLALLFMTGLFVPLAVKGEAPVSLDFQLTDTCPASFELQDGGCVLRSRYKEYRSLRDAGVGG